MKKEIFREDTIVIDASIDKVWDAFINPDLTVQYMYGCDVESSWEVGADVLWRGRADKVVYVSGKLIEIEKPNKMVYSVIDPNANYDQTPENHLVVTYEVSEKEEGTEIRVTQGDFGAVADGDKRYKDVVAGGGFMSVLEKIKELLTS